MRSADLDGAIAEIARGAVDLHGESGPSVLRRRLDHLEAARQAEAEGLRAIVFQDHYYSVTPITAFLRKTYFRDSPLELHSGVVLNNTVGGLNPDAVEHALKLGGKVISMPTVSATNHIRQMHRSKPPPTNAPMLPQVALTVVNERGGMRDDVKLILDLIAKYDGVLAAGHLHVSEVLALFANAKSRGVKRLLVSHPTAFVDAQVAEMKQLADMGAYIEHCSCELLPKSMSDEELGGFIRAVGSERTILGASAGGAAAGLAASRFEAVAHRGLSLGFAAAAVRRMIAENPCRLLGIAAG